MKTGGAGGGGLDVSGGHGRGINGGGGGRILRSSLNQLLFLVVDVMELDMDFIDPIKSLLGLGQLKPTRLGLGQKNLSVSLFSIRITTDFSVLALERFTVDHGVCEGGECSDGGEDGGDGDGSGREGVDGNSGSRWLSTNPTLPLSRSLSFVSSPSFPLSIYPPFFPCKFFSILSLSMATPCFRVTNGLPEEHPVIEQN